MPTTAVSLPLPPPITTSNLSSFTSNGVTVTMDRAMPVGQFVTGEYFIVSNQAFSITSVTPNSADISADGNVGNGLMQDPYITTAQGFDQYLANSTVGAMRFGNTPYSAALNRDPAINGAIAIAAGAATSFVKSVRLSSVTSPENWQTIEKYVDFHVLPDVPLVGSYPPSVSATTKTIFRRDQVDSSVLRSWTPPGAFTATYASASALIPQSLGLFGATGEQLRRFRLDAATGGSTSNYSAQLAAVYSRFMLLAHSTAVSSSDRQAVIDRIVKEGIQVYGLALRGFQNIIPNAQGGAGQQAAMESWIWLAALLLNNSDMLEKARGIKGTMTGPFRWASDLDTLVPTTSKGGVASQPFLREMIGTPICVPDEWSSAMQSRYMNIGAFASGWELLPIMLCSGGVTALLGSGGMATTNQPAACVAHADQYRQWSPFVMSSYPKTSEWDAIYDSARDLDSVPRWTGKPQQIPYGDLASYDDDIFTAGAGSISWDVSAFDYATETITSREVRYSIDGGIQWVTQTGVGSTGTLSSLLATVPHWCGIRSVSASGAGPWSANFPYATPVTSGTDRGKRTPTGTAITTTPAFAVNPALAQRDYAQWAYKTWTPAPELLPADAGVLGIGSGYPTAAVSSWSFKMQRADATYVDGVLTVTGSWADTTVAGASNEYELVAADEGKAVRGMVQATNAGGSSAFTPTAPVYLPTLPAIDPDNRVITFGGEFKRRWPQLWNTIVNGTSAKVHDPNFVFQPNDADTYPGLLPDTNGALAGSKSGAYPRISINLGADVTLAAGTYSLTFDALLGYRVGAQTAAAAQWTGDGQYSLGTSAPLGDIISTTGFARPSPWEPIVTRITRSFTLAAPSSAVWLTVSIFTATGSTAGGNPAMTKVTLVKTA